MVTRILIERRVEKDLEKVPRHVASKLKAWVARVLKVGLSEVRKVPGFHDEPLSGSRKGQRSIRLSKGYRAFYSATDDEPVQVIQILEVNKHDY